MRKIWAQFLILLALCTNAFGNSADVDVLIACAPEDHADFIFSAEDFVYFLNADGALGEGGAKLTAKESFPVGISPYQAKTAFVFKLNVESIQRYLDLRNGPENPHPELVAPKNMGEVLQEFNTMAASGCDFLAPTSFHSRLKMSEKLGDPELEKLKAQLALCEEREILCEGYNPKAIDSLQRDIKEIERSTEPMSNPASAIKQ